MTGTATYQGLALAVLCALGSSSCSTTETKRTVDTPTVATYRTNYSGPKYPISVGRFSNASPSLKNEVT